MISFTVVPFHLLETRASSRKSDGLQVDTHHTAVRRRSRPCRISLWTGMQEPLGLAIDDSTDVIFMLRVEGGTRVGHKGRPTNL